MTPDLHIPIPDIPGSKMLDLPTLPQEIQDALATLYRFEQRGDQSALISFGARHYFRYHERLAAQRAQLAQHTGARGRTR